VSVETFSTWRGTAEALATTLKLAMPALGLRMTAPTVRTIRLWRSKRLITQTDQRDFAYRQILESLTTAALLQKGWTLAAIAQVLPLLANDTIEANLRGEAAGQVVSWVDGADSSSSGTLPSRSGTQRTEAAENATILLAQGILREYERVLNQEWVRQDDGLPRELQAAMCRFGRLYIEEQQEDRAACVHDVLARARYPLGGRQWGLAALRAPDFRFADAVLVDPDFKVPTPDCATIADIAGAFGEDNLLEFRFHNRLREASDRLGRERDGAYTAIRELIGRRSLLSEHEFAAWLVEQRLTPLQQSILEEFFQPVSELWHINGYAHRCFHCGTLMRPHPDRARFRDGRCPLRQCNGKRPPRVGERLDPMAGLHIAKPQILLYWTGPAIDDLAIYDEAKREGLFPELYPECDLCDVAIDGRAVGIDAKSYSSPVSLALRLNKSIGGLIHYRRRIIAVGDELLNIDPGYIATVCSTLEKRGDAATLEILPVSKVVSSIVRSAGVEK
jgi:DNA-binding transcriptional MerR regulator